MFKNFKASEILIIVVVIIVIFVSEYLYLVVGDKDKAIFIGFGRQQSLVYWIL